MIDYVCDSGVPAYPENAHFYGYYMGDPARPRFYSAVEFEDWCWFTTPGPARKLLRIPTGRAPATRNDGDRQQRDIRSAWRRDFSALEDPIAFPSLTGLSRTAAWPMAGPGPEERTRSERTHQRHTLVLL